MSPAHRRNEPSPQTGPITAEQRRAEALRRAAHAKHEAAISRAERAIRELVKTQREITFRAVARTGGVSLDFLYANTDLRRRIETLRAQQQAARPAADNKPAVDGAQGNITHVLTAKLREERAARQTAVTELEQRLSAAHGELLRLRRILDQHGIQL